MTEGGIASWKKKEGESFSAGDVILEIVRLSARQCSNANFVTGDRQGHH